MRCTWIDRRASLRFWGWLLVAAGFMVGCQREPAAANDDEAVYETKDRTGYFLFRDGNSLSGGILPGTKAHDLTGERSEALGYPLYDCSTGEFECLRTFYYVFAVPRRSSLSKGLAYQVAGVQFTVLDCTREGTAGCDVALVAADCQRLVAPDTCALGGESASEGRQITYFIYNKDFGVTAFGAAGAFPEDAAKVIDVGTSVAGQYVLQGQRGLLLVRVRTADPR